MGIFDRFKKRENNIEKTKEQIQNDLPFDVSFQTRRDGSLQVDFYDKKADFRKLYDSTRLIMQGTVNVNGDYVKDCLVSWYNRDNVMFIDNPDAGHDYQNILADIDGQRLQTDAEYCQTVMAKLLEKNRVENYLNRGLEEQPTEMPCGNYIGGVRWREDGCWGKYFSPRTGIAVHNSDLMKRKRFEHRQEREYKKQEQIRARQEQIKRLEQEIKDIDEGR